MDGDEEAGADHADEGFHFFAVGVAGGVDVGGAGVVDADAASAEVVGHAVDGAFVAGDDAGGEDDGVAFGELDVFVFAECDAGHDGEGFALGSGGEDEAFAGRGGGEVAEGADVFVGGL